MSARHIKRCLPGLLTLTLLATAAPAPAQSPDSEGFISLFNGNDLSGWRGDSVHWSVEDGAITGKTTPETLLKGHNTFLVWQGGTPGDFVLRLKYKIRGGNSGIQYRSKLIDPEKVIVGGYQGDIDSTGRFTGINYEERGRSILAERGQKVEIDPEGKKNVESLGDKDELLKKINPDDWNDYVITARGNHLTHAINGATMSEVIDNQSSKAATSGILALQLHAGPAMTIQFKDIRLKELK
jgi:hypothetical protein